MRILAIAVASALTTLAPAALALSYSSYTPSTPVYSDPYQYRDVYRNRDSGPYGDRARVIESRPVYDVARGSHRAIVGYDVTYEFDGREHTTRLAKAPGSTLRLGADIRSDGMPYG